MIRRTLVALALLAAAALLVVGSLGRASGQRAEGGVGATAVRTFSVLEPACTISDPRLSAISGMATRTDGIWVVNDRGSALYRLGSNCKVVEVVDLAPQLKKLGVKVSDVEDLAVGPDGWLWVSDSGGNRKPRGSITLIGWKDDRTPVRTAALAYGSGQHDAEALLVDTLGRAVVVTKASVDQGPARVFQTRLPLGAGPEQNLHPVGSLELQRVEGSGPGAKLVTSADVDRTGTFVVLRTYTNAWEYDAPDGDVATALVSREPRFVPLPPAQQGEAIAYSVEGSELLATGEGSPVPVDRVQITRSGR